MQINTFQHPLVPGIVNFASSMAGFAGLHGENRKDAKYVDKVAEKAVLATHKGR